MDVPPVTELEQPFPREWLNAEGKLEVPAEAIQDWLSHENNRLLPAASVVYRAWLDATKDTVAIQEPLAEWLALNGPADDIAHVFRAWLRADGRFTFIRSHVFDWVRTRPLGLDASYLLKYVVRQRVLPDDVALKALAWCANFASDPDAIWRLTSLTAHVGDDLFGEALRTSEPVLEPILANPQLSVVTRSQVTTVLWNLSTLEHLASQPPSRELDTLLRRWMNHPQSFEPTPYQAPLQQKRQFLTRLVAALESEGEMPAFSALFEWIKSWDERTRVDCKDLIKRLRVVRHDYASRPKRRPATLRP
ncbi:MAG TPA: hypothetical protein VGJ82_03480 [Thermoanaerobaculia bacterium]|jgi:hypothetical protein